jgi:hypothetical protein
MHLLLGERFKTAFATLLRNLEGNRVAIIQAVYETGDGEGVDRAWLSGAAAGQT